MSSNQFMQNDKKNGTLAIDNKVAELTRVVSDPREGARKIESPEINFTIWLGLTYQNPTVQLLSCDIQSKQQPFTHNLCSYVATRIFFTLLFFELMLFGCDYMAL